MQRPGSRVSGVLRVWFIGALGTAVLASGAPLATGCAHAGAAVDVVELDAATAVRRLESGDLTSRALVEAYLERIARLDREDGGGPALRSLIEVDARALAEADACDAERRAGHLRGPLHGLPIVLKDNIDVAGLVTSAGSLALADHRPARDSFLAARLRAAGAIILGKTNLSEWANFRSTHASSGWSSRGGQTKNPYVLDRSPCGSSSGTGTAIAASLALIGVGTETDGSILCPAAMSGLVGLKPTVGLVSRDGIVPISVSQDTAGPMGRTVADVALLLNAMAGVDARDPASGPIAGKVAADYRANLRADALAGKRIGILRQAMGALPEVDRVTEAAIAKLKSLGAVVSDMTIDTWSKWDPLELDVLLFEFKAGLADYLGAAGTALKSLADVIAWNQAHAATAMPYFGQELFLQAEAKGPLTDPVYLHARDEARRLAGKDGLVAALERDHLDALFAPTVSPTFPIDLILGNHFVAGGGIGIAAVAGTPSITVPAGETHGLPLAVMFLGPALSEVELLGYAYAFEQATHARTPPAYLPTLQLP